MARQSASTVKHPENSRNLSFRPFRRCLCGLIGLLVISLLASGCVTPGATTAPDRLTDKEDPLAPPLDRALGTVLLVDAEDGIALIQVGSSFTRTAPSLITRNEAFAETSRLEPTRFQRGRTLGARIVQGLPNPGDEVFAAP